MKRPRAIGAYIFAGGFTLGVKKHFDVHCVLEESMYGVKTMRHNQPEIPVHVKSWPLDELKRHEWDLIYGNPPCAAWSQAGAATKKGRTYNSSPLLACTERYFTLLEDLHPKVWAWESVQNAWAVGEDFVRRLAERARNLGYSSTIFLHDAQYLGVPQSRKRMFMIVHRVEGRIDLPDFTKTITIDEALRVINDPGAPLDHNISKHAAILSQVRQGENLSSAFTRITPSDKIVIGERGQVVGRAPFTIKRARSGKPAPVIMHELIHATEDRGLSIKELAALCGYPPMYEFIDARDAGQVGRGVCPPVGEYLARNVARAVAANVAVTDPVLTLVDYTTSEVRIERLGYHKPADKDTANNTLQLTPHNTLIKTEAKPKKAKGDRKLKVNLISEEIETRRIIGAMPDSSPLDGEGSGRYIRRLLRAGLHGDQILELVHAHYPDSKATKADIAWNRGRMRKEDAGRGALRVEETGKHFQFGTNEEPHEEPQKRVPREASREVSNAPGASPKTEAHVPQPARTRQGVDPDRERDLSSLRANSHGLWCHRDYGAHFFRWGFAGRFVTNETDVLDVGCGPDVMMINALTMPRNQVPHSYVGVDLNREPRKHPARQWAELKWEFNFVERGDELEQFDLVTCFEVIEHMRKADGLQLLQVLRRRLRPSAALLLSTPVFNGKAAANHCHEWEIDELKAAIEATGMRVERRHGTFASQGDIRRAASAAELDIVERLSGYYSGEVLSCFLAPLYPDASRNNVWIVRRV